MFNNSVLTSRNTTRLHYKDQMVDDVQRNNDCLFLNHTKPMNTLYKQNADLLSVKLLVRTQSLQLLLDFEGLKGKRMIG